jgi:protein TonB
VAPRRVFITGGKLVMPSVIPQKVAMLKEEDLPPDVGVGGVAGGVPGGVPGGQMGGVIGGIIGGVAGSNLPPPPRPTVKAPVRVGGRVKAPQPLMTPPPMYPALARQAKLQGDVVIDAVIDASGNVVEMKVVSGHPLLLTAAMDALRRWKYEPTYLNDEPTPVALLVTIRFRLD